MKHTIEINLTQTHEAKCAELGNRLHAYPLDVLDAVLRDPEVQADFGAVVDRALDKHFATYRAPGPRPLVWPTAWPKTQNAAPVLAHRSGKAEKAVARLAFLPSSIPNWRFKSNGYV